jgi:hypothetical protein
MVTAEGDDGAKETEDSHCRTRPKLKQKGVANHALLCRPAP